MTLAITSTGWNSANDRSPSPYLPALRADFSVAAASHTGGWGSWKGFGVCIRSGKVIIGLSQLNRSCSHIRTTISVASCHSWRERSSIGTPNAICSIGVERPVPHSTRPWLRMSTVATFSATRAGCWNPGGIRTTPKPSLMFSVQVARPPSTTSDEGQAERPSRKWCSTHQMVWYPNVSASFICSIPSSYTDCSAAR